MRLRSTVLGYAVLASCAVTALPAPATAAYRHSRHVAHARYAHLQCVPFARNESGVEITGNAATWWEQAEGIYERGHTPEIGSVLSFQGSSRIPLGHVAVVSNVISHREIEIDHANWGGGIHRNVSVVDVSPRNDWTALRVEMGQSGEFGATYAANGFIYDRATGTGSGDAVLQVASARRPMSVSPVLTGLASASRTAPGRPEITLAASDIDARDPMETEARDPFETFRTPWRLGHRARPAATREPEEVADLPTRRHHRRHR